MNHFHILSKYSSSQRLYSFIIFSVKSPISVPLTWALIMAYCTLTLIAVPLNHELFVSPMPLTPADTQ